MKPAATDGSGSPRFTAGGNIRARRFPVVGIGASAGGLAAFTLLLKHLPAKTGMAFVFVQHLRPRHESGLPEILRRATAMPVVEATDGRRLRPDVVYVMPSDVAMTIVSGRLRLHARLPGPRPHFSIDQFFVSLARERRQLAIGVVLSGQAADGTAGLAEIKACGGLTFAQDQSAEYESMPANAIAAGDVDFVLGPVGMARELTRIGSYPPLMDDPVSLRRPRSAGAVVDKVWTKLLRLAQIPLGVDLARYQPAPLRDRIARRMRVRHRHSPAGYARLLSSNLTERETLAEELLLEDTKFFRDAGAFEALKMKVFSKLIRENPGGDLRVWSAGCGSGQEAYSLAMVLTETAETCPGRSPTFRVFGTDVMEVSLQWARRGLYPKSIGEEMSAERLKKFFVEEPGGYRVSRALRERCIFGRQDLLGGAPFSRMDLISCRNVVSRFAPEARMVVLPTLHRALRPSGCLFLGADESIGVGAGWFRPLDASRRIFARKAGDAPRRLPSPAQPHRAAQRRVGRSLMPTEAAQPDRPEVQARRAADRLAVNLLAPPSVLIDAAWNVVDFRGRTAPFLTVPRGGMSFHLLRMARPGLVLPLRAAITQARKLHKPVRRAEVRFGELVNQVVSLQVFPLSGRGSDFWLIVFGGVRPAEEVEHARGRAPARAGATGDRAWRGRNAELERELRDMRDYLQSLQREHDTDRAAMQTALEESQSVNEELQSANEELETSIAELQSGEGALLGANPQPGRRRQKSAASG